MRAGASLPASLRGQLISEWKGELLRDGDALLSRGLYEGTLVLRPGAILGSVLLREYPTSPPMLAKILMIGTLRVGYEQHLVGVTPGWNGIWLGRTPTGGRGTARLWCASAYRLRQPWGYEGSLLQWHRTMEVPIDLAIEGIAELLAEQQRAPALAWRELVRRYRGVVGAALDAALLYCAARGQNLGADDLARGIWPEWTRADLLADRHSVAEVIALALVLCGPYTPTQPDDMATRAEQIVSCGLMLAVELPLVDTDSVRALLRAATDRLARAIPQWDMAGLTTDWPRLLGAGTRSDVPPSMMPRWHEAGQDVTIRHCAVSARSSSGYVEQGAPSAIRAVRNRQNPQPTSREDLRRPVEGDAPVPHPGRAGAELPPAPAPLPAPPVQAPDPEREIVVEEEGTRRRATARAGRSARRKAPVRAKAGAGAGGRGKKKKAAPV